MWVLPWAWVAVQAHFADTLAPQAMRSPPSLQQFMAGPWTRPGRRPDASGPLGTVRQRIGQVPVDDPLGALSPLPIGLHDVRELQTVDGGTGPVALGVGPLQQLTLAQPNNHLRHDVGFRHLRGPSLRLERAYSAVSGRIIRDKIWVRGSTEGIRSTHAGRSYHGVRGLLSAGAQPSRRHRIALTGLGELSEVEEQGASTPQAVGLGIARWRWFFSQDVGLDSVVSAQRWEVGDNTRGRMFLSSKLDALRLYDGFGRHNLTLGVEVERVGWSLDDAIQVELPALRVPDAAAWRAGVMAQDRYRLSNHAQVDVGVRADHALGRLHLGPRLAATWDPSGRGRVKLTLNAHRRFDVLLAPAVAVAPEQGLPRVDEVSAQANAELVDDFAVGSDVGFARQSGLPTFDALRADRSVRWASLFVRKVYTQRWDLYARWRAGIWRDPATGEAPDSGRLEGYAHEVLGHASWWLPTDPWVQRLTLLGQWRGQPIGGVDGSQWQLGLEVDQYLDLRKGDVIVELAATYRRGPADQADALTSRGLGAPTLELVGWQGWRASGGVRYVF